MLENVTPKLEREKKNRISNHEFFFGGGGGRQNIKCNVIILSRDKRALSSEVVVVFYRGDLAKICLNLLSKLCIHIFNL